MDSLSIRGPRPGDLAALVDLYNHYIRETAITFDLEPYNLEDRQSWFDKFKPAGRYQLFIAEVNERVAGYASTGPFRDKRAYDTTVEVSIYLDPTVTGRGIGRKLYAKLFESIAAEDIHRAIAGITLPNVASVALHEAFGFTLSGVMSECGRKFGRYHDVGWYEKAL